MIKYVFTLGGKGKITPVFGGGGGNYAGKAACRYIEGGRATENNHEFHFDFIIELSDSKAVSTILF